MKLSPLLMFLGPVAAVILIVSAQTTGAAPQAPRFPSHPDFKPTSEVPAMPKALMSSQDRYYAGQVSGHRFPSPRENAGDGGRLPEDDRPDG